MRLGSTVRVGAVVCAVLASAAAGCARRAADNLLIVSLDTTRADRLSAYGYDSPTSPAVQALARRGVLFERAYTHVPSTLPAHASIFTGLLPPSHGVRCNGKFRLGEERLSLAEILGENGFATAAVVGAFPIDERFGLAQGFDLYDDDFTDSAVTARRRRGRMDRPGFWIGHDFLDFERSAEEVTDRAIDWLDGRAEAGGRWFLFAHYFDPHWPYEPASEWAARFESAYDAEIAYMDHHLGRLLEAVGRLDGRTLIVLTADHGEGLGDHGELLHNRYLYDSTLHVPLVIALEGHARPNTRIESTVGHVDLLPTVLELLAVSGPSELPGRSLAAALKGGAALEPRPHYAETLVWALERPTGTERRALVDGRYKVIATRVETRERSREWVEVYDLEVDPGERTNRAPFDAELTSRLSVALGAASARLEGKAGSAEPLMLDEGARERLKSLGYL